MKKNLLYISAVLFSVLTFTSCGSGGITWTQIFYDDFNRTATTYDLNSPLANLGSNYRAVSQSGSVAINNDQGVICYSDCVAEYQTPLTTSQTKLTVRFNITSFDGTNFGDGVLLQDAVSTGGCQVAAGYVTDGTSYKLAIVDKDTQAVLASAEYALQTGTIYYMDFIVNNGALTLILNDNTWTPLQEITATYDDTDCIIQEPSFQGRFGTGDATFDDFYIFRAAE